MNIVDLLVTIVVVTILVTIVLAVITYVAYKLRLAREPQRVEDTSGPQYFVRYDPPGSATRPADTIGAAGADDGASLPPPQPHSEGHAAEA